ncbi:hypothetical protein JHD50_07990 [Sulfurimonas sp. MAG313]|nr:hypothetical protein [Sulfurimonas sp. MAG313]MDF1881241.1 hypothetical protein [Sulfurimonas sp. MAG313]
MIKLSYTQYSKQFICKIQNINELSVQTLQELENFASTRSGSLDYTKESFCIPKRIALSHVQELFKLKGLDVFITEEEAKRQRISNMATINFGKYKGTKWTDLDDTYLLWLSKNLNSDDRQIAISELESRKQMSSQKKSIKQKAKELEMIIGFGKFRGQKWGELPKDYLSWVVSNLQGEAKRLAEIALSQ